MYIKNAFNQSIGFPIKDWQHKAMSSKACMQGNYCKLELLDITRHAKHLFHALSFENDGSSWTYLPYGPFVTCGDFSLWLQKTSELADTVLYTILDKQDSPIGIAGYLRINPEHGVIEVGHLHFSKLLQKTPAATEAMYMMMSYALDDLQYRRYEWKCDSLNQPSRNAAERYGFTYEGIFRQSNVFKDRNRDTAWFSIIDSEWPTLKNKFIHWLLPKNFDETGNQKMRLRELG